MARNRGDENCEDSGFNDDVQEEEEALSLCDLPVQEIKGENPSHKEAQVIEAEEEFEFGSWGASLLTESEMCAADDVFFKGQILPLRLSVSSDNGLAGSRQDSRNPSRCASRSESMEHNWPGGFTGASSRSSSLSSRNSLSSSTATSTTSGRYKPRVQNQFHTHQSPKPQIAFPGTPPGNADGRSQKSTIWGVFRLGLVRTPEIKLQELKLRSQNKSSSSSSRSSSRSSSSSYRCRNTSNDGMAEKKTSTQGFLGNSGFSNCKCSVGTVETVTSRIVTIKSKNNHNNNGIKKVSGREVKEEEQPLRHQQQKGKQGMSHRRTFEWLKKLQIADVPQEALA